MAALDIGYRPGVDKMTEKPKLLFLLGAVSYFALFTRLFHVAFFINLFWGPEAFV